MNRQQGSMKDNNEWNERRVYDSDSMSDVEQLLMAMEDPSMGMTHSHSYDTSETEDEYNLAGGNFKPSQSKTTCGKLSTQAVKREILECLIRSRCGSLAENLCGSVSGLLEEEDEPTRVECNGKRINRKKARYPRNKKISKADKDVITVRRLICPERETMREVDHGDTTHRGRDLCKNDFTRAQHLLKDVDRHITSGEDSNEEALNNPMYSEEGYNMEKSRRQFSHDFQESTGCYQSSHPIRDVSNDSSKSFKKSLRLVPSGFTCSETLKHGFSPKVNLPKSNMSEEFSERAPYPSRPDARGDHCNLLLQPTVFHPSFPTVTSENMPTNKGFSFTKYPKDPREPDYDVDDGHTKSVRVPARGVLKHNHSQPKTKTPATKRHPVPTKPIVSKHPELATITEERELKVSTNITLSPDVSPRLSDYTQNFFPVEDQQLDDTMRLRFDEEIKPTYQRPPTLNMRKEFCASRWDPRKGLGKDAYTQVSDSNVLDGRERFNKARAIVDKQEASFRLRYRPSVENEVEDVTRNESETETAIEYPETDKVDLRWKHETGNEFKIAESKATSMNSHMSVESTRENSPFDKNSSFAVEEDSELRRGADVRTTDDVKVAEQIPSANDVSLPAQSLEILTPCASGTTSKVNAFSIQKSPIWENILFGGDKLNFDKEIAVLLWMCDLSEQLEQRSRASADRMRAVVRMGDVTLRKLRLLKDSLLNAKVAEGGGVATQQMIKRQ